MRGIESEQWADVIVVGLGAFGSATLYQLARRGVRALGIDRFTPPHDRGSSHGATRITRLAVGEGDAYVPLIRRSNQIWDELEQAGGTRLAHRVGGLIMGPRDGTIRHHGKPDFVRRCIDAAQRYAVDHEVLDGEEIRYRYPQFETRGDELGYFEPEAGVLLPEACIDAQLTQARRHGARVRCGETVLAIERHRGGVSVRTSHGVYHAGRVALTAGPWIPGLAQAELRGHLRVMRQTLFWYETARPAWYEGAHCPIFIWMHGSSDEDYMYGFPMVDGKPGVKVASEQYSETCDPDTFERAVSDAEARDMYERHVKGRLREVSPDTVHRAACLYTVSTDSGFIVDRYRDMDEVLAVSACSGHGFKNSAGLGEVLALQLMGERRPELAPFALGRLVGG